MSQSKEHQDLGIRALRWIASRTTLRGLRASTEVNVDQGYIADGVALCRLQNRFQEKYVGESTLFTGAEIFDLVIIFEAKATRSDFLSTFGKTSKKHRNRHTPVGSLHFVVVPKGLIKPDEVPEFWGILETRGRGLTEIKKPKYCDVSDIERMKIAESLLWIKTDYWNSRYGHQLIEFVPTDPQQTLELR